MPTSRTTEVLAPNYWGSEDAGTAALYVTRRKEVGEENGSENHNNVHGIDGGAHTGTWGEGVQHDE